MFRNILYDIHIIVIKNNLNISKIFVNKQNYNCNTKNYKYMSCLKNNLKWKYLKINNDYTRII